MNIKTALKRIFHIKSINNDSPKALDLKRLAEICDKYKAVNTFCEN